jgi:hypothetical protein
MAAVAAGVFLLPATDDAGLTSDSSSMVPPAQAAPTSLSTELPRDTSLALAPLAGLMPWDHDLTRRWWWSGAWLYPVGPPHDLGAAPSLGEAAYRVLRGLEVGADGSTTHQGVDLSNRSPGGAVSAAANGVVIRARESKTNGYGHHVVLAHRLDGGGFAYSVYAHLAPGSIAVREGDVVPAGTLVGRVGRTGRASTDHLHFEVRVADDPFMRWERVPPVDPLAFVRERRSLSREGSWAAAYLAWAERSALIAPGDSGDEPLLRQAWWRMLVRASRLELSRVPADLESLRRRLVDAGLLSLPVERPEPATIGWEEMARDLARLSDLGVRLPPCPVDPAEHRSLCSTRLNVRLPAPNQEGSRPPPVTVADACLALAELNKSGIRELTEDRKN